MSTANTSITSDTIVYSPQQVGLVGTYPIFVFPGVNMPTLEDLFERKTGEIENKDLIISEETDVFESGKKYYKENKALLLKEYIGKYIAIFNNQVVDSDKDFSKLAERVYGKYGYLAIYMPFVDVRENVVRIPSSKVRS